MPPKPRRAAQHRVVESGLLARLLQLLPVIFEAQGVSRYHAGVALFEAAGIGEQAHAIRSRERVVVLTVGADVEAVLEVLLVDRLPASLTLGEDAVNRTKTALRLRRDPRILPTLV